MVENNHHGLGSLTALAGRVGRLAMRSLHNRVELLAVEFQEERLHVTGVLIRAISLLFLGLMAALLLTLTIILAVPEHSRVLVTAILGVLYLCGAVLVWLGLSASLKREPFAASMDQVKKDRLWLESLK